jgi:hypothetical protein
MEQIRIPLDMFNLDGFISETLRFLDNTVDYPTLAITWVEAPGRCPNDETDESWDFKSKLLTEAVYLFFPFAITDMEGSFDCADGQSYRHPSVALQQLAEDQEEPDYGDQIGECPFGDAIIGYLIRVEEGTISVASAVCAICGCYPPTTVDLLPDGDFLEKPLVDFIKGFVKADHETLGQSRSSFFNIGDFRLGRPETALESKPLAAKDHPSGN